MRIKVFRFIKVILFVLCTSIVLNLASNVFVPVDYSIDEEEGGLRSGMRSRTGAFWEG